MALIVSKHHKTFLMIDGEKVDFRIARLSGDEMAEFVSLFNKFGRDYERGMKEAAPTTDEERAMNPLELAAHREAALTPEQREANRLADLAHEKEGNEFAAAAIVAYVKPEAGAIVDGETNTVLTSGEQLVEYFAARGDVMRDLVAEIYLQNKLTEDAKKNLRLVRASSRGSNAPKAVGETPAPTAESVAPSTSADPAPATV